MSVLWPSRTTVAPTHASLILMQYIYIYIYMSLHQCRWGQRVLTAQTMSKIVQGTRLARGPQSNVVVVAAHDAVSFHICHCGRTPSPDLTLLLLLLPVVIPKPWHAHKGVGDSSGMSAVNDCSNPRIILMQDVTVRELCSGATRFIPCSLSSPFFWK